MRGEEQKEEEKGEKAWKERGEMRFVEYTLGTL